jgi:hypothetical protein
MPCRLADGVQVRKESWGLLFYVSSRHRVCFVKTRDWLYPEHFDGTWSTRSLIANISSRTCLPVETIERSFPALIDRLIKNRVIIDEVP